MLNRNVLICRAVAAVGGLYLGYLAHRTFVSACATWRSAAVDLVDDRSLTRARGSASYFFTGLTTNLLNPKIGVFYVSVMPGLFLGHQVTAWLGALLGTVHATLGLVFLSGVAALSGFTRRHLSRPRVRAAIEFICGLCLLGFGVFVVVGTAIHSGLLI